VQIVPRPTREFERERERELLMLSLTKYILKRYPVGS
jgi:hypothetical protein